MISLPVLFWMYVVLFAMIGAMRGWAKEILVTAGVIVAFFVVTVIENFIPFIRDSLTPQTSFWVRMGVLGVLTFFGYQGPNLRRFLESGRFVRDRFESGPGPADPFSTGIRADVPRRPGEGGHRHR